MISLWIATILLGVLSNTYEAATIANKDLCTNTLIFKLSLSNRRHTDGKWETQVQLDRGNQTENLENDKDLHLNVKQTVATCNCTRDMLSVEANIIAPPPRPGKNYTFYPNLGYYFLHQTPHTSVEANSLCNIEGAHLAVINSKEEADVITNMIKNILGEDNSSNTQSFIGLYKNAGGEVLTILGNVYKWPNGINEEEKPGNLMQTDNAYLCGTINNKGNVNFLSCQQKLSSICKQGL